MHRRLPVERGIKSNSTVLSVSVYFRPTTHSCLSNKSVVFFLAGAAKSHTPMSAIYLYGVG